MEGIGAFEYFARGLAHFLEALFEHAEAALNRLTKTHFLLFGDVGDEFAALPELGILVAHEIDYFERYPVQKGLGYSKAMTMAHGPAHDTPKHVFSSISVGQYALCNQKCCGSSVVGDHANANVVGTHTGSVGLASDVGSAMDQFT